MDVSDNNNQQKPELPNHHMLSISTPRGKMFTTVGFAMKASGHLLPLRVWASRTKWRIT